MESLRLRSSQKSQSYSCKNSLVTNPRGRYPFEMPIKALIDAMSSFQNPPVDPLNWFGFPSLRPPRF
jgi:hypothetical protein